MKKVFSLGVSILGLATLLFCQSAIAQPDPNMRDRLEQRRDVQTDDSNRDISQGPRSTKLDAPVGPKLTLCPGEYAYCGASTCRPTGKKIKVKVDGGKKQKNTMNLNASARSLPKKWPTKMAWSYLAWLP